MASSSSVRVRSAYLPALFILLTFITGGSTIARAQQPVNGFALERLYPSAPGAGWFVMDDLNFGGGFGGAVSLTGGYARNPLIVTGSDGKQHLALISNESFVDLGLAATYNRYRLYVNLPMPLELTGSSGVLGPYQFTAPASNVARNPDTIADPRLGFDVRFLGEPGSSLRLGFGAQLLFPSGSRADYVSDARYRAMFRFLAAGDAHGYTYAGQVGIHVRPLDQFPAPGGPNGDELLFGVSAGRKLKISPNWNAVIGPEIFGEFAFRSFPQGSSGNEALLTSRFDRVGAGNDIRLKLGVGHGMQQSFGAPEWRVLVSVELVGQRPKS